MCRWKIYYDESTFSYLDGEPNETPQFGVICILQDDELVGRKILHFYDWYFWEGQEWMGCDIFGLTDRLMNDLPVHHLRAGRTVPGRVYRQIMDAADHDLDFPPRSGKLLEEKRGVNL